MAHSHDTSTTSIFFVVWNMFYFPIQLGIIIIPIDFPIFQMGLVNHQPVGLVGDSTSGFKY